MGGTTGQWKLPYPTGTDFVRDGDDAMKALADRVELTLPAQTVVSGYGAAFTAGTRFRVHTFRGSVTSNANGQVSVASNGMLGYGFAGIIPTGPQNQNAVMFVLDELNSAASAAIWYCYNPNNSTLLPNRTMTISAVLIGWG